jgi:hypothetical protein
VRPWHIKPVLVGRPAFLRLLIAATLLGCTGGQSGTETPSPRDGGPQPFANDSGPINVFGAPPCACALADPAALLRATLLEIDPCRVRARVEQVLDKAPGLELALTAGAELDVVRATGCGDELAVEAGDLVLLVYAPAPEDGGISTALVATWGSEHVFGMEGDDTISLPESERDRLLDPQACAAWFDQQTADAEDASASQAKLVPSCESTQ